MTTSSARPPAASSSAAARGAQLGRRWYRARPALLVAATVSALVVLLLWPWIADYYSYNAQFYVGLLALAAITTILTTSLNLCMGYGGLLSLMHTGLQLLGGYAVAGVSVKAGLSPWLGLLCALALGVLLAVVVLAISLRATYLYFGMITLAANLILVEGGREWESVTGGIVGISGVRLPSLAGQQLDHTHFYYVVLLAAALVYVVQRNLIRSGVGRATMAIRESTDTAAALGIQPATAKLRIFAISGGIGSLAGGLYALQLGFVNPDVGLLDNGLIFFVGLLLGGIGTLAGPILGVAVVSAIDFAIRGYADYRTLVLGLILLVAMILVPRGIVGTWKASRLGRDRYEDEGDTPGESGPLAGDAAAPHDVVPAGIAPVQRLGTSTPALEGVAITKRFGGVTALDQVSVSIPARTIAGIIGPNGSGKSTLIACLTRFLPPDAGQVRILGAVAPHRPDAVARRGVTRVFQVPHLFERVSVLDNVLTGMRSRERYGWVSAVLRLRSYRRADAAERAEAQGLLAFAGLGGRAQWPASSLSHGQKRLLEVVRAVATRPRVLILDEPATGLTGPEIDALARLMRALRERGLSIVLIEHNIEFVMAVCDTITVLDSGRVIASGRPEEVRASPAVIEAYLGRADLVAEST